MKFVERHHVDFGEPIRRDVSLCLAHVEKSCFENSLVSTVEGMEGIKMERNLINQNCTWIASTHVGVQIKDKYNLCKICEVL